MDAPVPTAVPRRYRRRYPMIALLLGAGAPAGLVVFRAIATASAPTPAWVWREVASRPDTYGYLLVSTTIVFTILGFVLGAKEDELAARATTDELTGLPNRRTLHARLADELRRSERYKTPLSLLFVDLDGLKQINDRGGHEAGDRAIRAVAEALRRTCRSTDLPGRWGGDEFAILAPHTTAAEAMDLADRLRTALHAVAAPPGGVHGLSVSIGVVDAADAGALRAETLYDAADRALYDAKSTGRDRAVRFRPSERPPS